VCLLRTGMDPRARRAMWGAILAATQAADVAVVLTTHSMEEVSRGSTEHWWDAFHYVTMGLRHAFVEGMRYWSCRQRPDCAALLACPGGGPLQPGGHHARGQAGLRRQPAAPEEPVRRCAPGCRAATLS
jgi:hypothetical protein